MSTLNADSLILDPKPNSQDYQFKRSASRKITKLKYAITITLTAVAVTFIALAIHVYTRYSVHPVMPISIKEYDNFEYPEDPAGRSYYHGRYNGRHLTLISKDERHFDFVLESSNPHIAKVVLKDVDVSLMTPSRPEWIADSPSLERIALTDRQWNRQQVSFNADSPNLDITGGDGFEAANLYSVELAKNCLNAGLWEILLFTHENGAKTLYYQGWFDFPMGHYKNIFELNTQTPYWKHWYKLEHWSDPAGEHMDLEKLRRVVHEQKVAAKFHSEEPIFAGGEQKRKMKTVNSSNLRTWGDFYDGRSVEFASFVPPGRYSVEKPWGNEFWRLAKFEGAILREIKSPADGYEESLHEVELLFEDTQGVASRFFISGFKLSDLPRLTQTEYANGFYRPMGIAVPPFFQSYTDVQNNPPHKSPYFSVHLDNEGRWINHHEVAVDGPVMHLDDQNPNLLHIYLLSYERHSLVGHFTLSLEG